MLAAFFRSRRKFARPMDTGLLREGGGRGVRAPRQSLHARFGTSAGTEAGMCDALTDENRQEVEAALISGAMPADAHSVLLVIVPIREE